MVYDINVLRTALFAFSARDAFVFVTFYPENRKVTDWLQKYSEEHNHVGSCCLGIGQGRDMLFGNLSEI